MKELVVDVPATVANLGPGFDAVGLALDLSTRVEFHLTGDVVTVEHAGAWADSMADGPTDATNLLARAFLELAGARAPEGVRIVQHLEAPVGRGFGSSASAIIAGIVAADAFGLIANGTDLLQAAIRIEGHPDNVAPCLLGGITATAGETTIRVEPPDGWAAVLAIAPTTSLTASARARMPDTYPRSEMVAQSGRAALLGLAIGSGDLDALFEGTEDHLHQPTRLAEAPESAGLVHAWRAEGIAAFLSGAGPSVAAIVPSDDARGLAARLTGKAPEGWEVRACGLRREGARIISS